MCHLKVFVFFSSVFKACRTEYHFFRLHLSLWFAYRNKTKQFTGCASQSSSFPFSSQDFSGCFFLHVYIYIYIYRYTHASASSATSVSSLVFLLPPCPRAPPDSGIPCRALAPSAPCFSTGFTNGRQDYKQLSPFHRDVIIPVKPKPALPLHPLSSGSFTKHILTPLYSKWTS